MRVRLGIAGLLLGLAWPIGAGASGDVGCYPEWRLTSPSYDCGNRIVIGPGNDTRVNLMLLLQDRAGFDGTGLSYPNPDWESDYYGRTFLDWDFMADAFYPKPEEPDEDNGGFEFHGSRCQSVKTGGKEFLEAADRNGRINGADRQALVAGRVVLQQLCESRSGYGTNEGGPVSAADLALEHSYASAEAREFANYMVGAAAFYLDDWREAQARFSAARTAKDEWVRETALYMAARSELAAANDSSLNDWGDFEHGKGDEALAGRAAEALEAYLAAYPEGRYAVSANGLVRRANWLQGNLRDQGRAYAQQLAAIAPEDSSGLINEIDDKFLLQEGADDAVQGPLLLAVHDLLRMRGAPGEEEYWAYDTHGFSRLTAAELAAQEAAFAGNEPLYEFLKANYAFYVDKDYRAVLRLLPDDARQPAYTPLQFSRQALRGLALAALEDRNEAGFWQELLAGSKGLYQRPTVELGLALNWERGGQVEKVFAPGSPIEDEFIRKVLIEHSAGPEVLRAVAGDAGRSRDERDLAAYVLLYKELSHASYAAALRDLALARADAPTEEYDEETYEPQIPLGQFLAGAFSDGYACPTLRETVAVLARDPRSVKGRLCLGDFYRLNGFDQHYLDEPQAEGELGSFAPYPGARIERSKIYADIIGQAGVSQEDRAYALYRAVHCYAPSGYSSCGGEEVAETQRRAWFRRLKSEFADTRWGREIEYYW